jgi:hypothetical protein
MQIVGAFIGMALVIAAGIVLANLIMYAFGLHLILMVVVAGVVGVVLLWVLVDLIDRASRSKWLAWISELKYQAERKRERRIQEWRDAMERKRDNWRAAVGLSPPDDPPESALDQPDELEARIARAVTAAKRTSREMHGPWRPRDWRANRLPDWLASERPPPAS